MALRAAESPRCSGRPNGLADGPKGQENSAQGLPELPRRGGAKLRLSRGFTAASPKTPESPVEPPRLAPIKLGCGQRQIRASRMHLENQCFLFWTLESTPIKDHPLRVLKNNVIHNY